MSDIVITDIGTTKLMGATLTEPLVLKEFAVGGANESVRSSTGDYLLFKPINKYMQEQTLKQQQSMLFAKFTKKVKLF